MPNPNCHTCVYRGNVPGDAHSCCTHPAVGGDDMLSRIVSCADGNAAHTLEIEGNPHGIRQGWFYWPANFDPVWLENCNGYKEKA